MALIAHSIFPAAFVHAGGTLNLRQLDEVSVQPDSTKSIIIPGGAIDAGAIIQSHALPIVRIGSRDLTTILGTVSLITGLNCTGAGTIRFQKRADGSTFATGASHVSITSIKSFLHVESISASQNDPNGAVCRLINIPLFDGTNAALVINAGVNFDAVNIPLFTSAFFLGPVYLGAAQIEGITNITVEPAIEFNPLFADGCVFAGSGTINARPSRIKFTMLNAGYLSTITSMFGNAFASSLHFYFIKGIAGGSRELAASTVHCKITAASGDWTPEDLSVRGNENAALTINVIPTGSLTMSVASAIG